MFNNNLFFIFKNHPQILFRINLEIDLKIIIVI
jgi:hypothetical protein